MTLSNSLKAVTLAGAGDSTSRILEAFEEVTLLSTRENAPLNDLLRLVGRRLCELVDVSRCSVYLRRSDGRFQGQVGYSVNRKNIDAGVSRLVSGGDGDQFTAEILEVLQPVVVRDASRDPRTIQKTMRVWGVRDMLGVPLIVEDEVIGIIYLDDEGHARDFTDHHLKVAQAFAGLSALAVRQAWLFGRLAERSEVIDHQRRVLSESTTIHERVTRAVLDGADTETILDVISELLGKPVVLYGPDLRALHWTAPAESRLSTYPGLTPAQVRLPHVRRTLAQLDEKTTTIILRATPELRCRRVFAKLVADDQCLGYLELCELGRPLGAVDSKALAQAALAVSLKLLAEQRRTETLSREKDDYLSDLLHRRRDLDSLAARANDFGIDLRRSHAILRIQYDDTAVLSEFANGQSRRESLEQTLTSALAGIGACRAHTGVPGADVMLVEAFSDDLPGCQTKMLARLQDALPTLVSRLGVRLAVLSELCRPVGDLAVMAVEARQLAEIIAQDAKQPLVAAAWDYALVRLVAQGDGLRGAVGYAKRLLTPLHEHDAATGGDLALTLRAFIDSGAQVRGTAHNLGVHENTVRYRLRRIQAVSTIEPERLVSLAVAHLAFQIESLISGATAVPAEI